MLKLVLPSPQYLASVRTAIAEYQAHPSPFDIHCVNQMIEAAKDNFATYFQDIECKRQGIGLLEGYVPNTTLWLIDDEKYVGSFDLRHELNAYLLQNGGHIAYQIIPSARRKGYVKAGLKLTLEYARKKLGIEKALLTCNFDNIGSYKAMSSVMHEWGGEEISPSLVDGHQEHRVWINTQPK